MEQVTEKVWDHERFKQARQLKQITGVDAARELGVSSVHLSYVEHGKNNPSLKLILKMSEVYGLPTSFFLKA